MPKFHYSDLLCDLFAQNLVVDLVVDDVAEQVAVMEFGHNVAGHAANLGCANWVINPRRLKAPQSK